MNKVLKSTKQVSEHSKDVKINLPALERFASELKVRRIESWDEFSPFKTPALSERDKLHYLFVLGSMNFCYGLRPKWGVTYQDKELKGAWGMSASLFRAHEEGLNIFEPGYLEKLSLDDAGSIFRGSMEIPLLKERVDILREIGRVTNQKYDGEVSNLICSAKNDVLGLLEVMTSDYPSFNDVAQYGGKPVFFYKRAQLFISDVYKEFRGEGIGRFGNIDELTIFSDYKIPQLMRHEGILEYSPGLAHKVDGRIEIPAGSPEEVEIRANTVWAGELIKRKAAANNPGITTADVDNWLWVMSKNVDTEKEPYHWTKSIFY